MNVEKNHNKSCYTEHVNTKYTFSWNLMVYFRPKINRQKNQSRVSDHRPSAAVGSTELDICIIYNLK